jgi:hypothetical protein
LDVDQRCGDDGDPDSALSGFPVRGDTQDKVTNPVFIGEAAFEVALRDMAFLR